MSGLEIGIWSLVAILVLIQLGLHVGFTLIAVSIVGVIALKGNVTIAGVFLSMAALSSIASYSYAVIPLFVLMGLLVNVSGLGKDMFAVSRQLFRSAPGGMGIATIFANAIFAAVNGTSIASASVFTRIAVPEMLATGFSRKFSVGLVAGSSVLGMLIPPSLLLILFGIVTESSIGALFAAGIIPGLLLALIFTLLALGLTHFAPGFVWADGRPGIEDAPALMSAGQLFAKSAPVLILVVVVLGGIYGGVFSPTEAGGVGAAAALLIAVLRRSLTFRSFMTLLIETGRVTASITFLLVGAHMYARLLAMTGLPAQFGGLLNGWDLGIVGVLLIYVAMVIVLGAILDSASIILILIPLFLPIISAQQVDIVWFGILTIVTVEIGLLTPPLGIACFVVKANLQSHDIRLGEVFAGAFPFVLAMMVLVALLMLFPGLTHAPF